MTDLYDRYHYLVKHVFNKIMGGTKLIPEDEEEIIQELELNYYEFMLNPPEGKIYYIGARAHLFLVHKAQKILKKYNLYTKNNCSQKELENLAYEIEEPVLNSFIKEEINKVFLTITERERKILELRFGLNDMESKSINEAGYVLGLTGSRVNQIERKALRKLRHPSRSKLLLDFNRSTYSNAEEREKEEQKKEELKTFNSYKVLVSKEEKKILNDIELYKSLCVHTKKERYLEYLCNSILELLNFKIDMYNYSIIEIKNLIKFKKYYIAFQAWYEIPSEEINTAIETIIDNTETGLDYTLRVVRS